MSETRQRHSSRSNSISSIGSNTSNTASPSGSLTLEEENTKLRQELELERLRVSQLQEQIVAIQAKTLHLQIEVEKEEEHIANTLLKKIDQLKKEKANLVLQVEREEEYLTNTLQKKLDQIQKEKAALEQTLEYEQENVINKMQKQMEKLEQDKKIMAAKLGKLQHEKIELENTLEKEQEFMINKLTKKMEQLQNDKRHLQEELHLKSPKSSYTDSEVQRLKDRLRENESKQTSATNSFLQDQEQLRQENLHLRQKLAREMERVEQLASEKGIDEFEKEKSEERFFNLSDAEISLRMRSNSNPIPPSHLGRRDSLDNSATPNSKWWSKRTPVPHTELSPQNTQQSLTSPPSSRSESFSNIKPVSPTSQ